MGDGFDWVDKKEEEIKEERAKGYFDIKEGSQQFVLLSHCAPFAQVYDKAANKYRAAEEGDRNASIKGVCWVLQDGLIKQAKLPYTIVKEIRALQQNPDWEFVLPFPHTFTLKAVGAGKKEVEYSLTASPKTVEISKEILTELSKKPSPEDIIEKMKSGPSAPTPRTAPAEDTREVPAKAFDYPQDEINPEDIPF